MVEKSFIHKEKKIAYSIERKNVKNINLRIVKDGRIVVSASKLVSEKVIDEFVKNKKEWIYQKLTCIEKLKKEISNIKTNSLKYAYYLGDKYLIKYINSESHSYITNNQLMVFTCDVSKEKALQDWYLMKANKVFSEIFEKQYKKIYPKRKRIPKISIKNMKTRWGSCNKKLNKINLNLKLIHQPPECIEYVITHELIHLTHPNHSKKFYRMLEEVMFDFKDRRMKLKSLLIYI